ncbi:MAG: type II secretion system protein GspG [Planctomycetes bacterium]|nr:type II secretion system protein GspG [Planctomycetota bacterium]
MTENSELERAFEVPTARRKLPLWARLLIALALVSVVPCVGLLATLVVPNVVYKLARANVVKAKADINSISGAVTSYAIDNGGRYPDSLEVLWRPDSRGFAYLAAEGPLDDPWGKPYGYEPPSPGSSKFRVFSLGADGKPGGEGDDRDIDNVLIKDGKI